jgi:bifunctional non-homologous end joining protein LigD
MATRERLTDYDAKRDFRQTPEPGPDDAAAGRSGAPRFVVQEHHARALHWDLRLEHDGVLWSWAVPKGIPMRNRPNHLAVRTEDHPLEYLSFEGQIPTGQYGAGSMSVWDRGTYEPEKLEDDEVILTFYGGRVRGKYALFRTRDNQWMLHRMSPPDDPAREEIPSSLAPMLATAGELPRADAGWAYEMKWDGMRVLLRIEGGRLQATSRNGNDVTGRFPELRGLGEALGTVEAVLDGEVVALDDDGRPRFERLQPRIHVSVPAKARQLAAKNPVVVMLFDVLWLEGHSTLALPYRERRRLLERLQLGGPAWQTPPFHEGNGAAVLQTARELGLEGIVAKRIDSPYRPGQRSDAWRKVKVVNSQEFVVGGWLHGNGRLAGHLGSLLVGYHDDDGTLQYAGRVGSGIDDAARELLERELGRRHRTTSPFSAIPPRLPDPNWVEPELVVQVVFAEWTSVGSLRAPRYTGTRGDVDPRTVVREPN